MEKGLGKRFGFTVSNELKHSENWYDKEFTFKPYPCPRGCGTMIDAGIVNAIEHWHDCVGKEGVRKATKKTMRQLGYSKKDANEALKNLGL